MAVSALKFAEDESENGFGGPISDAEAAMRYQASFGDLPDKTVLYDPWTPMVPGKSESGPFSLFKALGKYHKAYAKQLRKAFTFGTPASTLLPVYVDPEIIRLTNEETPFLAMIKRVTNKGRTADFNQLTALSAAQWKSEESELAEQDDTYVRDSKQIKFGYAIGKVTGPAMAAMKAYADAKNLEVQNKTVALRLLEQETAIQGSVNPADDAEVYTGLSALAYDGLIKQITTNAVNASSADITSDMIRTAIRNCREAGGRPNLIVMQSQTLQVFKESMTDYVIHDSTRVGTLEWGFQGLVFDGIPVVELGIHMPTAANKKQVLVLDMRYVEMRVLQDAMMEPLAKTTDSDKFHVKVYEVLVNKAEKFCAKIYAVK